MNLARWSYRLALYLLLAVPVLTPIFFLPLTTDWFQFNKLVLFYILTVLGLFAWLVYSILAKTVRLTLSNLLWPLLTFAAAAIASTFFFPQKTPEMWLTAAAIFPAGLVYYLLTSTVVQNASQVKKTLGFILAAVSLAALLGILDNFDINLIGQPRFTPAGSALNLIVLLATWLPAGLILAIKTKSGGNKLAYFLISGLIASSLILNGSRLMSNGQFKPILLPKLASWSIAADTLKTKIFLGVGPGNFYQSFNQFKPLSLNVTDFWNINFTTSGNAYFEILTTMGILGLGTFIWIIIGLIGLAQRETGSRITSNQMVLISVIVMQLVLGFFFPFTNLNWIMFFSALALLAVTHKSKQTGKVKDVLLSLSAAEVVEPWLAPLPQGREMTGGSFILAMLFLIISVLGLALPAYNLGRIYAAEVYFNNSLKAAAGNRGNDTYNLQIKALNLAPTTDRYHLSYSNTNLALANALASKNNLSDQEKQTVATLIQQAIREARTATQLQPNKAADWANLAGVYKNLVNFADDADQFAQAAYVRAIQLDPANPALRLDLGGLLFSLKKYDNAADRYNEAIALKPNYANAYYNLSYTYQAQGKWLEAYQAMQQAVSLVPADSDDAVKSRNELKDLEAKLPKTAKPAEASGSGELQSPEKPIPAPSGIEPINL